jgi:hypothetical protein
MIILFLGKQYDIIALENCVYHLCGCTKIDENTDIGKHFKEL